MTKLLHILRGDALAPSLLAALPFIARLIFASTLFLFFWSSALTKLETPFRLSAGVYAQIFPQTFEASGYDVGAMTLIHKLIAFGAAYGELFLPIFIVIGLFTRLSALGMMVFIIVMSIVDINAFGYEPGAFFDKDPSGAVFDTRLYWLFLLFTLVATGGGKLSADRVLADRLETQPLSGHS